jgi:16S rRNA (cytosine967-C5)-methyltransferase
LTVTRSETIDVVNTFLSSHPEFTLQPFPHPLEETMAPGTVQLWPHIHDGDSRFIAKMVRSTAVAPPA